MSVLGYCGLSPNFAMIKVYIPIGLWDWRPEGLVGDRVRESILGAFKVLGENKKEWEVVDVYARKELDVVRVARN